MENHGDGDAVSKQNRRLDAEIRASVNRLQVCIANMADIVDRMRDMLQHERGDKFVNNTQESVSDRNATD